jgi:hypothetical protein
MQEPMQEPLVTPEYDLLVWKGEAYRIPVSVSRKLTSDEVFKLPEILERRTEIASKLGVRFVDSEGRFDENEDCIYYASKGGGNEKICTYAPENNDPQFLSHFKQTDGAGNEIEFVASCAGFSIDGLICSPCPILTGLFTALIEIGALDEYCIGRIDLRPGMFPFVKGVKKSKELETRAVKLYKELILKS